MALPHWLIDHIPTADTGNFKFMLFINMFVCFFLPWEMKHMPYTDALFTNLHNYEIEALSVAVVGETRGAHWKQVR